MKICTYIHIYVDVYTHIRGIYAYICKILYIHRHTFKVELLLKLFNVFPPSVGKYPSASACTSPYSFCFSHPISFSFFEPYTSALDHFWKETPVLWLFVWQHSFIGPLPWQGQNGIEIPVLLLSPSPELELGVTGRVCVNGGGRVLLDCLPSTSNLPFP